ncbi:putative T7SS-secreted protein [Nocardioides ferulae]|uniref:putative T7SS-secreted protein n=1 Tax=Nocardioides ferulae TaxID=2340821 RepID=UPI000EB0DF7D|nr:hypothetical protein [Nocardioides ferulae]
MSLPAGAALGSTTDPKKLIVGEPTKVEAAATLLSDEARRVSGLADDVDAITTPGWEGGLGQPAYAASFADEQAKWRAYVELLEAAGTSISTYAGALTTAQARAADAIAKWEEGEQATADAVAAYNAAVEAYNASQCRPPLTVPSIGGGTTVVPTIGPAHPGTFVDPGEALREEAQQILDDARTALDEAGAAALKELGILEGGRTEGSDDLLGADGSAEGPSFNWPWWEDTFGKDPRKGEDGKYDDPHESPFELSLGSLEGEAWVYQAEGEFEDYYGDVHVTGEGTVTVLGADGSAEATINSEGLFLNLDGTATLVGAEGEVKGEYGPGEVTLSGAASVEATAGGHATIDSTGVHTGGEAFAGGKIEGGLAAEVAGVGSEVEAEGWYGVGVSGHADVGFDDGKLTLGGSGGVALGLGGKIEGSITLDFPEIWETGGDLIDAIGGVLG